ncbi:CHAT domain-containing protein [Mycena pura]|uniref:CHAT domain-containing protein n=1 Tax=Mycena pura TaxID=153505 RepID=A0AAD6UK58_9AGAR|nr:CHAT domain-containing protein [Mycena pura]
MSRLSGHFFVGNTPPPQSRSFYKSGAYGAGPFCRFTLREFMEIKSSIVSRRQNQDRTAIHDDTIHFACHGIEDPGNPLDSGLMLSDGRLKVTQIMRRTYDDRSRKPISLALLSACETAKGDGSTPDEAMHLAATLLFSRFRGVVGTIWTMNDEDGPKITNSFYEYLFKDVF